LDFADKNARFEIQTTWQKFHSFRNLWIYAELITDQKFFPEKRLIE